MGRAAASVGLTERMTYEGGSTSVVVNQRLNCGQWVLLVA